MDMTVAEFLVLHGTCFYDRNWALENYKTMRQAWEKCPEPKCLIWITTRQGVLSHPELILFACFCARQNWGLLTDERCRRAVEIAEAFVAGIATREDAADAARASYAFTDAATVGSRSIYTASYAATYAARAIAHDTYCARCASAYAAYAADASSSAISSASYIAIRATRAAQADWLREYTKPNFAARKAEEKTNLDMNSKGAKHKTDDYDA